MKKMKALISVIICIIIVFTTSAVSYAVNTEGESYKILLEHGFSEDYINNLTDTMIDKMAETIKEESDPEYITDYALLVSYGLPEELIKNLTDSSLKKLRDALEGNKISAVDYTAENETNNSDVTVKKLSVQLYDKNSSTVNGEVVCIYWEWATNKPLIREEDYITASWNKDIFCYNADSFYAEDFSRDNTTEKWSVSESYSTLAHISHSSIGHWTTVFGAKKQAGGVAIFSLSPTQPINAEEDYDRKIDITYTHETKTTLTVALCVIFLLLSLSAVWIITEIRKRRKK